MLLCFIENSVGLVLFPVDELYAGLWDVHGSGPGQGLHPLDVRGETLLQVLKNKGSVSSKLAVTPNRIYPCGRKRAMCRLILGESYPNYQYWAMNLYQLTNYKEGGILGWFKTSVVEPKLNCLPEPKLRIAAPAPASFYFKQTKKFYRKKSWALKKFCIVTILILLLMSKKVISRYYLIPKPK
jgi:hypothetical protein